MVSKEQLAELRELLEQYKCPPDEPNDDGIICNLCSSMVDFNGDDISDWMDDPICYSCWVEFGEKTRRDLPDILDELEALRSFRDRVNAYVIPGVTDTGEAVQRIVKEHARLRAENKRLVERHYNLIRDIEK